MRFNLELITSMEMPWNGRCRSPHAPDYDPDNEAPMLITPYPQDGSGKTMPLPKSMVLDHHSAPYEHLPVMLTADGELVPPEAATDLLARIRAHNRWLSEAYPALVDAPVYVAPQGAMSVEDAAMDSDPPDEVEEGHGPEIDHLDGFGRP